ncbi:MAG TPA: HIT family protein [Burkholderiales bacterium]|nr:HIT family protein [Burkholderiales bacterium]
MSVNAGNECRFCLQGERGAILKNELALVKRDRFPLTEGHTLIVPRRHVQSFFELTADEHAAMCDLIVQAKAHIEQDQKPDGYNIGINDGTAAGQTIMHVHVHLIPRYLGDTADPRGGIRWIIPERRDYWKKTAL